MRVLSIAVAFTLAACGPAAEREDIGPPAEIISQSATIDGNPIDVGAPPPSSVSAEALVGRWGDNGDCTKDIVFASDGTFRSHTGGTGTWSLEGNRIAMSGPGQTIVVQVQSVNEQQLIVGNPDGSFGISQRC